MCVCVGVQCVGVGVGVPCVGVGVQCVGVGVGVQCVWVWACNVCGCGRAMCGCGCATCGCGCGCWCAVGVGVQCVGVGVGVQCVGVGVQRVGVGVQWVLVCNVWVLMCVCHADLPLPPPLPVSRFKTTPCEHSRRLVSLVNGISQTTSLDQLRTAMHHPPTGSRKSFQSVITHYVWTSPSIPSLATAISPEPPTFGFSQSAAGVIKMTTPIL